VASAAGAESEGLYHSSSSPDLIAALMTATDDADFVTVDYHRHNRQQHEEHTAGMRRTRTPKRSLRAAPSVNGFGGRGGERGSGRGGAPPKGGRYAGGARGSGQR
jgi:hypothetical protein